MLDVLMTLEAFFTLACHSLCGLEDIRGTGDFDPTPNADGSLRYPTAEVLYAPVFKVEKEDAHHPARFLFRFADVKDDIESIIRIWLQIANKLRPVRALYQSALYGKRTYLESEFLSMVQAVEVFHRRFRGGYYASPDEFEQTILPKLREAVPAETADELRKVIWNKLQYLNEYSLGRRLRELVRDHESLILEFVPDAYPLMEKIVQFRNHFTHYSGEKALSESDIRKIVRSVDALRLILELSLLKELHMSSETLARLARENRIYSHIKQTSPKNLSNQDDSSRKKTGD